MSFFGWIYGKGVAARNRAYDRGSMHAHTLKNSVVSVGNLSMGGSGKTPFVLALGKLLQERGVAFDILTRGYGRSDSKIRLVDEKSIASADAKKNRATLYGDEPLLLAQKLQVPVIVGPDRFLSGQ